MGINASTLGASLSLLSRLVSIKRGNRNRNEETLRSIPTQAGLDPVLLVPRPLRNCQNPRQTHISLPCIGEGYFFSFGPRSLEVSIGGRPCRVIAASDKGKSLLFSEAGVTWSIYCTKKRCPEREKNKFIYFGVVSQYASEHAEKLFEDQQLQLGTEPSWGLVSRTVLAAAVVVVFREGGDTQVRQGRPALVVRVPQEGHDARSFPVHPSPCASARELERVGYSRWEDLLPRHAAL